MYRLFVHLNCAFVIYGLLLWNGLTLLRLPPETTWRSANVEPLLRVRRFALAAAHLLALTVAAGSIVAGIDAGKVFNTWPLMNGA